MNTISNPNQHRHPVSNAMILIVDDNPDNRLLLASQLGMHGYQIIEADSGRQGLDQARENQPDLILLDVMMPIMNGFDVCTHLKDDEKTAHIPVIMVTALRDIEYRIRGIEVGADEFLSRPHHREELLVRVRSLIRLKQARDRLEEERNRLQLLYNVTRAATNTQLDIDEMMAAIITHTQEAVGAQKGSIMLLDSDGRVSHKILIRAGLSPKMTEHITHTVLSSGLAGWVIRHKKGDVVENTAEDDRWIILPDDTEPVGSAIGMPLMDDQAVVGVLILVHPNPNYFRKEHIDLLEAIAAQVTVAIRNASLFARIKEERSKLSALLSKSSDAIVTTDEDYKIDLINDAAEQIFNLDGNKVSRQTLEQIDALAELKPLFRQAQNQSISHEIQVDQDRTFLASVSPIEEIGYMAVMQDVTEMKRMEEMRLAEERRAKQMVKDTFARYMSPRLVDQVLSDTPSLLAERQRRHAVVMFADLRGFTRMVSELEPSTAINLLNEFFTQMTDVVYEYEGTIFDLAGDELMIGFNAPMDQKDAAYRAILTALSMQRQFDNLRRGWYKRMGTNLGLGVGVDTGSVLMGNVGAETRMNFAMVGDAVNMSHRLVDIATDGQIVISSAVYQEISRNKYSDSADLQQLTFEAVSVHIKGKTEPQTIYKTNIERTPLS